MPNGEVNTETEESIFKIQNYGVDTNSNVASGWFLNTSKAYQVTSGSNLNQPSIRIAYSDIPLEGILSYDSAEDPSRAFSGIIGSDEKV